MNVFDRQLGHLDRSDLQGWMTQIERHINYLQERLEYALRQVEQKTGGNKENE